MEGNGARRGLDHLEAAVALVRSRAPAAHDTLERFVREYYRQVAPEDLAEREPALA